MLINCFEFKIDFFTIAIIALTYLLYLPSAKSLLFNQLLLFNRDE